MKKPRQALIITHILREQPALILDVLKERGWKYKIINRDEGNKLPSFEKYNALIVMGGPQSANDNKETTSWMLEEIQAVKKALLNGIPYLGVCLGMQILIKAAGGEVIKSPRKEVGFRVSYNKILGKFYTIKLTKEGTNDPLFFDLNDTLPLFHLHGESVKFPFGTVLLATADVVTNQVVRVGNNAYGLQGHFELTEDMLRIWLREDPDLLALGNNGIEQIKNDFEQKKDEYLKTGKKIFNNFLSLAEKKSE